MNILLGVIDNRLIAVAFGRVNILVPLTSKGEKRPVHFKKKEIYSLIGAPSLIISKEIISAISWTWFGLFLS